MKLCGPLKVIHTPNQWKVRIELNLKSVVSRHRRSSAPEIRSSGKPIPLTLGVPNQCLLYTTIKGHDHKSVRGPWNPTKERTVQSWIMCGHGPLGIDIRDRLGRPNLSTNPFLSPCFEFLVMAYSTQWSRAMTMKLCWSLEHVGKLESAFVCSRAASSVVWKLHTKTEL